MRKVLALVALLLAAPAGAAAQESLQPIPTRAPVAELVASAPVEASLAQPVKAEARETAEARESRDQFAQRGSFWWLVGVIVIAGVLLAVLLD